MLIRHAERYPVDSREVDHYVKLTERGVKDALELGKRLMGNITQIVSSSVPRCLDTADAIKRGSGQVSVPLTTDWRLGNPGIWTIDHDASWSSFLKLGLPELLRRQVMGERISGYRELEQGTRILIDFMIQHSMDRGLSIYVSHDAIIAPIIGRLLNLHEVEDFFPTFLEGLVIVPGEANLEVYWRGISQKVAWDRE